MLVLVEINSLSVLYQKQDHSWKENRYQVHFSQHFSFFDRTGPSMCVIPDVFVRGSRRIYARRRWVRPASWTLPPATTRSTSIDYSIVVKLLSFLCFLFFFSSKEEYCVSVLGFLFPRIEGKSSCFSCVFYVKKRKANDKKNTSIRKLPRQAPGGIAFLAIGSEHSTNGIR